MDAARLQVALTATVFGDPDTAEEQVDEFFAQGYQQVTDGKASDRDEFVQHVRHLRTVARGGAITIEEFLTDGRRLADRHTVHVTMQDGHAASFEVLLIGELDDADRLVRVVETTRQLTGDPSHADLGSAAQ